jgi:hypothetical protein|tara:strand:+ start:272 stop:436 length:165 start_codon:yes stop_codon:yes gene_type:complete
VSDIIDMAKATSAGTVGVGTWYINLSQILQLSISVACLAYLIFKVYYLIKNKGL